MAENSSATCQTHEGKTIEFYCEAHNQIGCSVCATVYHRNCVVSNIPEIFKGIAHCSNVQQKLSELIDKINDIKLQPVNSKKKLDKESAAYSRSVKTYRDELVAEIDQLVDKAETEKQKYVEKMTAQLQTAEHKADTFCQNYLEKLDTAKVNIAENIQEVPIRETNLFVCLKQAETLMNECRKAVASVKHGIYVKPCVFYKNTELQVLLKNHKIGGKRRYPYGIYRLIDKFNNTCNINAAHILDDGRLIATDYKRERVTLFDMSEDDTPMTFVSLKAAPWDLAMISKHEVAVSLPGNKTIAILSVGIMLKTVKIINTEGACYSIALCGDKLLTVQHFWLSTDIIMLDLKALERKTKLECPKITRWNEYIRVHPDNNNLYLSQGDYVTCVTLQGKVVGEYRNNELKAAVGLAVHIDGSIYVCCKKSNNIHRITADCKKVEVLLNNGELVQPQSVSFNRAGDKMFVSEAANNIPVLKVFKVFEI